jgi:ribosome-interacting GTPase 1
MFYGFSLTTISFTHHRKKDKGGINFTTTAKDPKIDLEAVKAVCSEYR